LWHVYLWGEGGLVRGCRVGQRTGTVGHKFTGEGLQGVLSDVPYMGIAESMWSERYFGTFICGVKVVW
ncbi:major outer sheath C-terminal domain-containing protein, partial [Treponema paraluiscuniculi]|uniref:major outer sheath C-terminal domain-containing protein n=1 Tax=Treponema paraluiscuniculi TaxID=53435 RepID=UPI002FDBF2B6